MSKTELIRKVIAGEKVDRYPFSFWTHLPGIDLDPVRLAETTYQFFKDYDFDLIKTMNNGMYAIEDYGCQIDYSDVPKGGVARLVAGPIREVADWQKITHLNIADCKAIQRELYSLKLLMEMAKDDDVPIIFTVFSPLTTADKLSGKKVLDHIAQGHGKEVHRALQNITDTTVDLVRKLNEMGVAGIYLATQLSNYSVCSPEIYEEYGARYDRQILLASNGYADTVHCHGNDIMYDLLKDYPVDIFNWHAHESAPDLLEARQLDKCKMAGIVRGDITADNWDKVRQQIDECVEIFHGHKHIMAAGCVIRYPLNTAMLHRISEYIHAIRL